MTGGGLWNGMWKKGGIKRKKGMVIAGSRKTKNLEARCFRKSSYKIQLLYVYV